jgi:hypothetical protein
MWDTSTIVAAVIGGFFILHALSCLMRLKITRFFISGAIGAILVVASVLIATGWRPF